MRQFSQITDFIRELYKEPKNLIPLHAPVFIGNEKKYVNECIDSTNISSVGKFKDKFEEMVEEFTKIKKAIVCVNGTNALHLALKVIGVDNNSEVITQPLTFIATINAIAYCGAKPIFVDVDKNTLGLSPEKLKHWLLNNVELNPKTNNPINKLTGRPIKACVPMHTFGHPCLIDEIIEICNLFNIPVIEDAAESLGSYYKNQHTGSFGKIGVLSFNGNKIVTTGGGGMILTNDEVLGAHIKHLTMQAKITHQWEFIHNFIGYNYRMPNINAAIGVAQMEQLELYLENKRKTAQLYKIFFDNISIKTVSEPNNCRSNYWLNSILFNDRNQRDKFLKFTNENGVMTRPAWRLMNKLEMFKDCQTGDLFNAHWLEDRIVNIPSSIRL